MIKKVYIFIFMLLFSGCATTQTTWIQVEETYKLRNARSQSSTGHFNGIDSPLMVLNPMMSLKTIDGKIIQDDGAYDHIKVVLITGKIYKFQVPIKLKAGKNNNIIISDSNGYKVEFSYFDILRVGIVKNTTDWGIVLPIAAGIIGLPLLVILIL